MKIRRDLMKRLLPRAVRLCGLAVLTACAALSSCSQEDTGDGGTPLPEGQYPLMFTAIQTITPQTRISENTDGMSSRWQDDFRGGSACYPLRS